MSEVKDESSYQSSFSQALYKYFKRGDWVPDIFKKILSEDTSVDLPACVVFSKIVYWMLPRRNGKKKYYGKRLRLSASDLASQTLLSYKQVKRALGKLENKYKFISRENLGKVTYITLNIETIHRAIVLHEPIWAHENDFAGPYGPIHIHKEQHKERSRNQGYLKSTDIEYQIELLRTKIENLENVIDDKQNELATYSMTEAMFDSICSNTICTYNNKLKYELNEAELLELYIFDDNTNVMYPAFSKLFYLYTVLGIYEHVSLLDLLDAVSNECRRTPDIMGYLDSKCEQFNAVDLSLDSEELAVKVNDCIVNLNKEIADYEVRLNKVVAELRELQT